MNSNLSNPAGVGVVISGAVKAVLIALASLGAVPLDDDAITSVTLAVAAVVDVLIYFGLVRPGVTRLQERAAADPANARSTRDLPDTTT